MFSRRIASLASIEDIDTRWITEGNDPGSACTLSDPLVPLRGSDDWAFLLGNIAAGTALETDAASSGMPSLGEPKLDVDVARQRHVLFAVRPAPFAILTTCPGTPKSVPASREGSFSVALLATDDFDVNEVDLSSLRFHHAPPLSTKLRDVNNDRRPDLVIEISRVRRSTCQGSEARASHGLAEQQSDLHRGGRNPCVFRRTNWFIGAPLVF